MATDAGDSGETGMGRQEQNDRIIPDVTEQMPRNDDGSEEKFEKPPRLVTVRMLQLSSLF